MNHYKVTCTEESHDFWTQGQIQEFIVFVHAPDAEIAEMNVTQMFSEDITSVVSVELVK